MRKIIVGDIHGSYKELRQLMDTLSFNRKKDRLISLGDLMDRGKQSYEVYACFRRWKEEMGERCTIIRGNHEQMLLDAQEDEINMRLWLQNGAEETIRSFQEHGEQIEDHVPWIRDNTVLYVVEEGFQCVHAGIQKEDPAENEEEILLWDRSIMSRSEYTGRLTLIGHTPLREPAYFPGPEESYETIPYGERRKLPEKGLLCLDTGCVFNGRLTAMVVEDGEYILESSQQKRGWLEQVMRLGKKKRNL